jgi:hypothetical protein
MPLQATVKAKNSSSFSAVRPLFSAWIYPQILLQTLFCFPTFLAVSRDARPHGQMWFRRDEPGEFLECGGLPPLCSPQIARFLKAGLSFPHSKTVVIIGGSAGTAQ